jgi:hypothetical protein
MASESDTRSDTPQITWAGLRRAVDLAARDVGEWAGSPMPVHGIPLVVEPRYPFAAALHGYCFDGTPPHATAGGPEPIVHNRWFSHGRMATVYVCSDTPDGPRYPIMLPEWGGPRLSHWITTIGASRAWSADAEDLAVRTLRGLVTPHAHRTYTLTGTFLETSRRSGVTYLFRKLRPTVALRACAGGGTRILAALCLHPIGYYEGTWAGAMVPTDDVLAHLLLMRAEEAKFWAKANHHPSWSAMAGI